MKCHYILLLSFKRAFGRKRLYPIHMNLVVRQAADEELGDCDRVYIIEPVEVFDCHNIKYKGQVNISGVLKYEQDITVDSLFGIVSKDL